MNQRNLRFIYPHNPRRHFPLADDKLRTKQLLVSAGVPVPKTYGAYSSFFQLRELRGDLSDREAFVIKPAQGRGGGGIVVISGRHGGDWMGPGGRLYTLDDLKEHISNVMFGVYSFDLADHAIIEEKVSQHPRVERLSPFGLADVRVIMFKDQPVAAMARIPTKASGGRANLHQGALGVGLDLPTGRTVGAIWKNAPVEEHPDTRVPLTDEYLIHWDELLHIARKTAAALPLKYLGVDICFSDTGPKVLEVNVRPGLQIQNANLTGLRRRLAEIG